MRPLPTATQPDQSSSKQVGSEQGGKQNKPSPANHCQLQLDWGAPLNPQTQNQPTPHTRQIAPPAAAPVAHFAMQHPQANRQIMLEQHAISYLLERRRRRSIGMRVSPQGLLVAAPPWVAIHEIEQILHTKARWIVRKLHEQTQQNATRQQQEQPIWQNGIYLPWQGGLLQVKLTGEPEQGIAPRASHLRQKADTAQLLCQPNQSSQPNSISNTHSILQIDLPANIAGETLRSLMHYWLQQQALALFTERLNHYAPQLGVRWNSLKLSSATTRWGSATSQGGIRLQWRLVQMPLPLLDYVIVHELAHLHEMNHSPRFWGWVEKILPDYRQRQYQLKQTTLAPW